MKRFNWKALALLSSGHMVTDIYQGALPTLLPFLKDKLSLSYAMAGAILMASSLTSSVIQPIFGFLSDKREKAFFLPLGCLCAGLGFASLSLPSSYSAVLFFVVVSGLGVASFHPEGYKTAHGFTGERKAAGMSIFSVGGNLGFALGPTLCLFVVTRLGLPYLPVMAIPALCFVALILSMRKLLATGEDRAAPREDQPAAGRVRVPPALIFILGTVVMRSWTQIGLMTYIPFYYIDHLHVDPVFAGNLVSIFLLGGVVGTLGGSPLADRWGHDRYLVLSLAASAAVLPLMFVVTGPALFLVLGVLGVILISTFTVTIVMAQQLLPKNLGIASGLMVGFAIGTGGIGVTLLGIVADRFGVPVAIKIIMVLPFLGFLLSLVLRYRRPKEQGAFA